jgi:hypothetical protein
MLVGFLVISEMKVARRPAVDREYLHDVLDEIGADFVLNLCRKHTVVLFELAVMRG